jgi:hypothetical protein
VNILRALFRALLFEQKQSVKDPIVITIRMMQCVNSDKVDLQPPRKKYEIKGPILFIELFAIRRCFR